MRAEILEKHTGDFTGKRVDDPEVLSYGKGKLSMAFPGEGSESQAQVTQRVRDFYETELLPQLEQGKNIFVAAHAGVVIAFDDIFNLDRGGTRVPNAAPLVVEYEDGKVTAMYHVDPAQRKHTPARRIA
jgi:bisphosphoglycerate-dependent phosphoglycerate mutase